MKASLDTGLTFANLVPEVGRWHNCGWAGSRSLEVREWRRVAVTNAGRKEGMLSLSLWTRCVRPWAAAAQKLLKVTKSTSSHISSAGSEPTRAAAATRDAPAKVGVYAGGKEMPFTSALRIEDPDKLPVRCQPIQVVIAPANA